MRIERYTAGYRPLWDEFVRNSANATFLHLRDYMDYHSHRFTDNSLMAYNEKGRLVALLPANVTGSTVISHQGLTYGGWLVARRHCATPDMLHVWHSAVDFLRGEGVETLIYKAIPWIYPRYPSDDDIYALFRLGAVVDSCSVSSAIALDERPVDNESSRQAIKRCEAAGVYVIQSDDYACFMDMLACRLKERYDAVPVHSVDEIKLLAQRFPEAIKLFMAFDGEHRPLAGTIIYLAGRVVHTQYIATTEQGRRINVLPMLMKHIMERHSSGHRYFDFGISCEEGGRVLNHGLVSQKYGLGGRPVAYTAYRLPIIK